ncbi:MFS transporter, partial [Bacillus spizizenii]|nr:MFS transporter [Bacillus spizizenii]
MRFIGVALGPPVFAALMSNANWLIFILSAFCSIIALFLVLFTVDAKKSEEEDKNLGTV